MCFVAAIVIAFDTVSHTIGEYKGKEKPKIVAGAAEQVCVCVCVCLLALLYTLVSGSYTHNPYKGKGKQKIGIRKSNRKRMPDLTFCKGKSIRKNIGNRKSNRKNDGLERFTHYNFALPCTDAGWHHSHRRGLGCAPHPRTARVCHTLPLPLVRARAP